MLELWLSCAVVKVPKFVVFKNRRVNYSGSGTVRPGRCSRTPASVPRGRRGEPAHAPPSPCVRPGSGALRSQGWFLLRAVTVTT